MLSFCHPGDSASLGSLCSGTVLVLKAPKCSNPAQAPMQGGPSPYCASWSCCNIRTDLKVFSIRFLQALREDNLKHSDETSELTKSNHMIHMDLGPIAREHLKTWIPTLWQIEILQELLKKPEIMIKDLR